MYSRILLTFATSLVMLSAHATSLGWGPKEWAHQDLVESIRTHIAGTFLLGLHGELFRLHGDSIHKEEWNNYVYAVRTEDGKGFELLAERNGQLLNYATVSADNAVTYAQTPEAKALTGRGFCGIRQWPALEMSKLPEPGKIQVFADPTSHSVPEQPKDCEAVFYALSDGGYYFCKPNGVFSPYPLWLMRVDNHHMRLVQPEKQDLTLLDIKAQQGVTIYWDGWMKELSPPIQGRYYSPNPDYGVWIPQITSLILSPLNPTYWNPNR